MTKKEPEVKIPCPEGLSEQSRRIWEACVPRQVRSGVRQMLLEGALREADSLVSLREKLDREGWTVTTGKRGRSISTLWPRF